MREPAERQKSWFQKQRNRDLYRQLGNTCQNKFAKLDMRLVNILQDNKIISPLGLTSLPG